MSDPVPNWDLFTTSEKEAAVSQYPVPTHPDFAVSPQLHFPETSSWVQSSFPAFSSSVEAGDYCSDIFDAFLSDVELNLKLPPEQNRESFALTPESFCLALDRGDSSDRRKGKAVERGNSSSSRRKGKPVISEERVCNEEFERIMDVLKRKQASPCKRNRTAEVHNQSERKRRDRINEKIRTLQELIPNCNKSDRASVLDGTIQYLKALKLQVEMISTGGGSLLKAPYVSTAGVQNVDPPLFSPFMPKNMNIGIGGGVGMGFGIGMVTMCYPVGIPMIAVPSQGPCSPITTAASLPGTPRSGLVPFTSLVPMKYMPFTTRSSTPEKSANDVQQVPVLNQAERTNLHVEGCLLDGNK